MTLGELALFGGRALFWGRLSRALADELGRRADKPDAGGTFGAIAIRYAGGCCDGPEGDSAASQCPIEGGGRRARAGDVDPLGAAGTQEGAAALRCAPVALEKAGLGHAASPLPDSDSPVLNSSGSQEGTAESATVSTGVMV